MFDFVLRPLQRIGFWAGLIFTGGAVLVGGLKAYEYSAYVLTEATVTALTYKCDMSYRNFRYRAVHHIVECPEVANVKLQNPDVSWSVDRVPFVQVAYLTPAGRPLRTTVRLSKLELASATIGQKISILQSPDYPETVSGPVNGHFIELWGTMLFAGVAMLVGSLSIKRFRDRQKRLTTAPRAVALALEMPLPEGQSPFREWRDRERKQSSRGPTASAA